ncbi:MAG: hypothetical protein JOY64_27635 [Alphaproteobacteria bacterium]|nr:hypothetical protein [Alphaproteobacteria bacterium]MBV8411430.1 hypothetical protein [Alphaproteobacteria bacterium]
MGAIVSRDGDSGVLHEAALLAFADAAILDRAKLADARATLSAVAGHETMVDAAAVIAGFDAITRVADGTGIPLEPPKAVATAEWRAELGIDAFWSAKV